MNLEVHIDELVLHGLDGVDPARLGAAVECALAHLFATQGLPPSLARSGAAPRLEGGSFPLAPGTPAEALGTQIAQAVYGGLNR